MARADIAKLAGRLDEARALYHEAAVLEAEAYQRIPPARPRTRGIIAVSAVSLFRLAADLDEAIRHAHRYLAEPDLTENASRALADLLVESQRESESRAAGTTPGAEGLDIVFRGPEVGHGLVLLDVLLVKLNQMKSYLYRVSEWSLGKSLKGVTLSEAKGLGARTGDASLTQILRWRSG